MLAILAISRRVCTSFKDEGAAVVVSDAAGARMALLKEAQLKLVITQKAGPDPMEIQVNLEHAKGTFTSVVAKDLPALPGGVYHPEGTVMAVQKMLLEFSPPVFVAWLQAQP